MTDLYLPLVVLLVLTGCGGTTVLPVPERSAPELIGVTVETSWTKSTHRLALATNDSHTNFTQSSSPAIGSDLSPSVSVAYVGTVELKNAFAPEEPEAGHLIAVRVSIFDQSSKETKVSETTYTLFRGSEVRLYENKALGLTVTAAPHEFD